MTSMDASLGAGMRAALLDEVRDHLPAFLGSAALERRGPVRAASLLLNLSATDLHRVLSIHMLMSDEVQAFVESLPAGVRRPSMATTRPRVVSRSISSGIDWAATMRVRATSSPTGELWVTRPAQRIFNTPENRALAWTLSAIQGLAIACAPRDSEAKWAQNARTMGDAARRASRTAWIETIPNDWPGNSVFLRLRADRTAFYRLRLANAAKYLRRLLSNPSPQQVVDSLCDHYFEPTQDWRLFEIAVLLRLVRALDSVGTHVGTMGMFTGSSGPFAAFDIANGARVRLWYQRWPAKSGMSEVNDAIRHYRIDAGGTRPDIVVELAVRGLPAVLTVLELKASSSSTYLASGLVQLVGYLRDRPDFTNTEACGWLVAPPSSKFTSQDPDGRALWVTDSNQVASRLLDRVDELAGRTRTTAPAP